MPYYPPAAASSGTLTTVIRSTDADLAFAVNTIYYWDISGFTSDHAATLPATAAVGDLCGVFLTTGDTAFEVVITATAGDTLNGVSGGTEWSRLFITNEYVLMRCTVANTTWVVETNGKSSMYAQMELTTQADGEGAATMTAPTAVGGAWTVLTDNGSITTAASSLMTMRRSCNVLVTLGMRTKDNGAAGNYLALRSVTAGSVGVQGRQELTIASANLKPYLLSARTYSLVAGDTITYQFLTQVGSIGLEASSSVFFTAEELL